jgi:outer membrane protein, heavy metal efflux system
MILLYLALALAAPLTFDTVLRSTEAHHPLIAVALAEQAAARGELMLQEGGFDPTLKARAGATAGYYPSIMGEVGVDVPLPLWGSSVSGGWRIGAGDFPVYDGKKKTNDYGELRLGLLLPLLRDGPIDRRRASIERSEIEQDVQRHAVDMARLELKRQAALAYWEWVAAGARLHVAELLLSLATTRREQLAKRAAAGDVPALDRIDNERLEAQRRARVVMMMRAWEKAGLDLSLYHRDDEQRPIVATLAELPALPAAIDDDCGARAALVERALLQRPDVQRGRWLFEQAGVEVRLAENQLLPTLSLSAQAGVDVGPDTLSSSSSSVWNPDPKTRTTPEFGLSLNFELPVLLRQARGRLSMLEEQRIRQQQQWRLVQDRVGVEVADACSATVAASGRVKATHEEVTASLAVENGERARYDGGDSTLLWVNLREQGTAEAQLSAIDAAVDVQRAAIMRGVATADLLSR